MEMHLILEQKQLTNFYLLMFGALEREDNV